MEWQVTISCFTLAIYTKRTDIDPIIYETSWLNV